MQHIMRCMHLHLVPKAAKRCAFLERLTWCAMLQIQLRLEYVGGKSECRNARIVQSAAAIERTAVHIMTLMPSGHLALEGFLTASRTQ